MTSTLYCSAMRSRMQRTCNSPKPADHRLVGGSAVTHPEAGVLGSKLVQHVGDALLVPAALRLDREPVHRDRKLKGAEVIVVLIVGIVQHRVELDIVDLGDRADVAWHQEVRLHVLLALQQEHVARP